MSAVPCARVRSETLCDEARTVGLRPAARTWWSRARAAAITMAVAALEVHSLRYLMSVARPYVESSCGRQGEGNMAF